MEFVVFLVICFVIGLIVRMSMKVAKSIHLLKSPIPFLTPLYGALIKSGKTPGCKGIEAN